MAKMTKAQFERSKFDVEKKGVKEGSKEDMARDRAQMKAANKAKGMKCGGKAKGYAEGGIMRGTGAAVKGKKFTRNG
jgi:hypothetical protein